MSSPSETLQAALRFHQAGELAQAEQLYRQILQSYPTHSGVLHQLGLMAHQLGRFDVAIQYIAEAIRHDPAQANFYNNLGEAYRASGKQAEAQEAYERALELEPNYVLPRYNFGLLLAWAGDRAGAQRQFEEAIRLQPNLAEAHNQLGEVLRSQEQRPEALAAFQAALRCRHDFVAALVNSGAVLRELERFPESQEHLARAVQLDPQSAEAHFELGNLHATQSNWAEAARCLERAVSIRPDFVAARTTLGAVKQEVGDSAAATEHYRIALQLDPDYVSALSNNGTLLQRQGLLDEALAHYDRALGLNPNFVLGLHNRASVYQSMGRIHEAITSYRTACDLEVARLKPESRHAAADHSKMLYALNFDPAFDSAAIFAEHLAWAKRYAESLTAEAPAHTNDRDPDRRVRIGYVSPNFRRQAVNFFSQPILSAHDHTQFEVFCYSAADSERCDEVTAKIKAVVDHWRDVYHDSEERLAQIIREDKIDILVDLTGHIGEGRLLTFARKPAPIQVTYIGYQATTGMSAMDYRLTDERADPPGLTDPFYTERLVRLPRAFFCYQPTADPPPITPLPARSTGYVTFGSFNNFAKVTPQVLEAWMRILARSEQSRLRVLISRSEYVERRIRELAESHGIDPSRIELHKHLPRPSYLRFIQEADISLDPFPMNGHTTTCDSIWMGVPVVMLEGQCYASRFGGSVLANVGLESLIAGSVEQYVDLAVELAQDLDRLEQLRSELRQRMADSALLDFSGFTRNLEQAYRQMWRTWCESPVEAS